ncbi:MAG: ABC transporter permease [Anaerolineales bacterium]|jgi:ABC-2 type transport system permease protein|nr:ABC transporter permease [Anaerolineales bacterium]MDP7544995.1 ABC transporter permease [Anaerolineales bacterium]|tara:strand:- start:1346 stop:2479 length:1134 start_codon:yes stop_codon:yes gene_type:complete
MRNSRLLSLIRKEFIQILRDPRTLVITFAIPVVQLFLLGYAANTDVRNVPLAVFDQSHSAAGRRLLDAYRAADYFKLTYVVDSEDELRALIDTGDARAGLIIPSTYGQQISGGQPVQIAFVLDGSDPTVAATALSAATLIGESHSINLLVERLNQRGLPDVFQSQVNVRTQVWYNPDLESAYFMVPALIGMILQMQATMLTSIAIVRERERGTIEQLIVTPLRAWELVVGKLIPYIIIAFFNTLEVLVIGTLWFDVPVRGSLSLLLALSGLFLVPSLGIGLVISTGAKTQHEAMMLSFFTMMPSIFLSGFLYPLAAMPKVLQWISTVIPLRYYLIIVRSLVLKGVGIEAVLDETLALAVFGVITMGVAALRLRKRLD